MGRECHNEETATAPALNRTRETQPVAENSIDPAGDPIVALLLGSFGLTVAFGSSFPPLSI
jgi:hypothetical protein